jgi:hypothetical protein
MPIDPERQAKLDAIANGAREDLRRRVDAARRVRASRAARLDRSIASLAYERIGEPPPPELPEPAPPAPLRLRRSGVKAFLEEFKSKHVVHEAA